MSASVPPFAPDRGSVRPSYEGLFGLLLVGLMLLSTLDETALAPLARGLFLGCFALLTVVNVGAAVAVYIGAALLFSLHASVGNISWVQRPDNFALLLLTSYLILGRCFTRTSGTFGRIALAIMVLLVTTLIHLVALVGMSWYWLTWFARMFAIPLVLFVLLRRAALSSREMRALLLIVGVLGIYLAAVSLLEALDWYGLIVPPWLADPEFNAGFRSERAGGLAMQPEWNALDMSLMLCVLLLLRLDQSHLRSGIGWIAGGALCLLAIFLTYTRAAWLGLLVAGVPLFWQRSAARGITVRRRALFVSGVLGFVAFVLFFPTEILQGRASDANTIYFRFAIWISGWQMLAAHPLFGVGFGQFGSHLNSFLMDVAWIPSASGPKEATIAHNTLLSVAAELGLVGLTLYIVSVWGVYKAARTAAGNTWGFQGHSWVAGFTLVYHTNVQFITAHWLTSNLLYFGIMGAVAGMRPPRERPAHSAMAARVGAVSSQLETRHPATSS